MCFTGQCCAISGHIVLALNGNGCGDQSVGFLFFPGMKKERGNMHLTRAEHKAGAQAYKQAINPGLILLSTEPASHSVLVCSQSYHVHAALQLYSNSLSFSF